MKVNKKILLTQVETREEGGMPIGVVALQVEEDSIHQIVELESKRLRQKYLLLRLVKILNKFKENLNKKNAN